jgi:hypothetical protein
MTVIAKPLVNAVAVPAAETPEYTTPVSTKAIIDKCTVTNTTATAATITLKIIPASGAAGASNTIVNSQSVGAGVCYVCPEIVGHILAAGDILSALAGTASALTLRVSGREVS